MDYAKKIHDMKRKLADRARDLDQKYKIKERLDQSADTVREGLQKGAEVASAGVDTARRELENVENRHHVSGKVKRSTEGVTRAVKEGIKKAEGKLEELDKDYDLSGKVKSSTEDLTDAVKDKAQAVGEKADQLLGEATKYYGRFGQVSSLTEKTAQAAKILRSNFGKAKEWIEENPGKAALISVSVIAGARAGGAFPSFDALVLGAGNRGHWLFHSALAAYGLRKISERYFEYLKQQEDLIARGRLSEAERAQIAFQRNIAKYVGAPLLGAFNLTTGVTLMAESLSPDRLVIGAPIELLLGGNPLLSGLWLFSNGLFCIYNGYKLFVMAVADDETMERLAREATYLLPMLSEG